MKDAFGVERISKGVPLVDIPFALKTTRALKQMPSGEKGFMSAKFNYARNKPETYDDIALSPAKQQKLANKLKELDRKHAGRFASSGPKVSRNDPSDSTGNFNRAVGTIKSSNVIRLSGRERVGKSDAFGVEITKGVPKFPDWMHARAIAKPDSPLTHAMRKLQAGHVNPKPEIKQFRPESGIHNGDKIITTGEHSPGRYFIRNTRTGNNSTARAEDINFKINRKKPKYPKQGKLF